MLPPPPPQSSSMLSVGGRQLQRTHARVCVCTDSNCAWEIEIEREIQSTSALREELSEARRWAPTCKPLSATQWHSVQRWVGVEWVGAS